MAPVHFYVTRNSNEINSNVTAIPFELALVNEGNAMNLTSGIFTAPRNGIYFFSFTGLAGFPISSSVVGLQVGFYLNGNRIATSLVQETNTVGHHSPLTLQLTLNLKDGDEIWVEIFDVTSGVHFHDDSSHRTHFTGFILEEEILASF